MNIERNDIERNYIKSLLGEIDILESGNRKLCNEYRELEEKYEKLQDHSDSTDEELNMAEKRCNELEKEINNIKNNLHAQYSTTNISNPDILDIFKKIKEGKMIQFIKPEHVKGYSKYTSNPFIFQYDNKGAIFDGKLLGMFEIKKGNIYYYHERIPQRMLIGEVCKGLLNITDESQDCMYRGKGMKKSRACSKMLWKEILKTNPVINLIQNKFVSCKGQKWIYTKNDGTKYILKENGKEEVY